MGFSMSTNGSMSSKVAQHEYQESSKRTNGAKQEHQGGLAEAPRGLSMSSKGFSRKTKVDQLEHQGSSAGAARVLSKTTKSVQQEHHECST